MAADLLSHLLAAETFVKRANALMELWPWTGLAGAGLAWALDHQIGSDGIFYECGHGAALTTTVGVIALLVTAACGYASFRLWRSDRETSARRFVALLGLMFAILLGLAILLPTIAGFILPECLT
jgi:hypothetical protein